MSEKATEISNEPETSSLKFKPGLNLRSLYEAFHAADKSAKAAQSAYKEAELEQRRRLVPACLELLSEWETATHGQTMDVYERAQLTAPAAAQHMDLARVYRLIDDETFAALNRDGTLLSVNQGAAIATAFELRKQFSLDHEKSNRHLANFAADCARLGTGPKEIKEQLRLYAEMLETRQTEDQKSNERCAGNKLNDAAKNSASEPGTYADTGGSGNPDSGPDLDPVLPIEPKSEPTPIERTHQCPRYVVVGTSFAEMKAAVVRLMNKESEFERYCKDGLALIAEQPECEPPVGESRSGKASASVTAESAATSSEKLDPFVPVKLEA